LGVVVVVVVVVVCIPFIDLCCKEDDIDMRAMISMIKP